jgi:type I restriction enzyme, S subunit
MTIDGVANHSDIFIATLADLVQLQRGYDLTSEERRPGTVEVIGGGGPNGKHDKANVKGPGVVVVRSGSGFGNVWWVRDDFWAHNTVLYVKSFNGNDEKFTYYALKHTDFSSYNSGGAQPSLNRNFIADIPIFIPPLPEQRRIAAVLDAWDTAIATAERLVAAKRSRKAALAHEMLTKGTNADVQLDEVCEINAKSLGSKTLPDTRFEYFPIGDDEGGGGWMTFTDAPSRARRLAEAGDVVYSTVRPLLRRIFRAPTHDAAVYSTGYAILHPRPGNDAGFIFHAMTTSIFETQILGRLTGSNYPAIGGKDLGELTIPAMTFERQQAVAEMLDEAAKAETHAANLMDRLRHQKRGLMQQLLTGKLRVPESVDRLMPDGGAHG